MQLSQREIHTKLPWLIHEPAKTTLCINADQNEKQKLNKNDNFLTEHQKKLLNDTENFQKFLWAHQGTSKPEDFKCSFELDY